MMSEQQPILVLERNTREVLVFSGIGAAETYIEPPDLNTYEAFQRDGTINEVTVKGKKTGFWGAPGEVKLIPSDQKDVDRLKGYVKHHLKNVSKTEFAHDADLNTLVELLLRNQEVTR